MICPKALTCRVKGGWDLKEKSFFWPSVGGKKHNIKLDYMGVGRRLGFGSHLQNLIFILRIEITCLYTA